MARITHRNDRMHRGLVPTAQLGSGSASSSTVLLGNQTWGSVPGTSFGSNSNSVGSANAPGASSSNARADHVHQGVHQLTSNGSNGRFEDVNFAAGSGIALGVSGQTVTITNTGSSSGGGGSGTLTTIEEVDGSPTSSAVTKLVLPNGTLGIVGTVATYTPASGSGVSWTQDVSESGTTFTNWTGSSGTWSSDGTVIKQTDNTAAFRTAKYNTMVASGFGLIVEVELFFPTAGQGGGGGFMYGAILAGATGNPTAIILDRANGVHRFQQWAVADYRTIATTVALDTWYKIRAVNSGHHWSVYKDGTLLATSTSSTGGATDYLGLGSYGAIVHFRNFKAWTLSGSAPA